MSVGAEREDLPRTIHTLAHSHLQMVVGLGASDWLTLANQPSRLGWLLGSVWLEFSAGYLLVSQT